MGTGIIDMINSQIEELKKQVAEHAVGFIQSGMVVGLGEGSTAILALYKIGEMILSGELNNIIGIPCSVNIEKAAIESGIPVSDINRHNSIDLTIDGADEVDAQLNLIKGGGGALLREKMVAQISQREIIIVDETKLSKNLGETWALPIEVVQFGWQSHCKYLEELGGKPQIRLLKNKIPYITDQGNYILDVNFGPIFDPEDLNVKLNKRSGIVEHGLFINLATDILISSSKGIRHLEKSN